jgi:Putative ER transporter, 6TM, N-terminal/Fusaric acid resistance protein-like
VNAIWLMVSMWLSNVLKAHRPQFILPLLLFNIYVILSFTYGPHFATVELCGTFVKQVLYAFLTGLGISTGVSFIIFPTSSRKIFFGEASEFLSSCKRLLKAQLAFVEILEHSEAFEPLSPRDEVDSRASREYPNAGWNKSDPASSASRETYDERAKAMKAGTQAILTLTAKVRTELMFAKREIAFGYLDGPATKELFSLIRLITIPMLGLSTVVDIFERTSHHRGWRREDHQAGCSESDEVYDLKATASESEEKNEWMQLMRTLHLSFEPVIQILDEGVEHSMILLKLVPDPRKKRKRDDPEKGKREVEIGDLGFADHLERRTQQFYKDIAATQKKWAVDRGLTTTIHAFAGILHPESKEGAALLAELRAAREYRAERQLFFLLYMGHLLYSVSKATLDLGRWSEMKVSDGTMAKMRFIFPQERIFRKWFNAVINGEDAGVGTQGIDNSVGDVKTVDIEVSFLAKKDLEHLPPKNRWERFGNRLRMIPKFLDSSQAKFGLRVVFALMSIGIIAFLRETQKFFIEQRLFWALFMISIAMNPTSGNATFGYICRILGTFCATVFSFISWYIVDGRTAGVIIFTSLFMMVYFYVFVKFPHVTVASIVAPVSHVLITGLYLPCHL